MFRLNLKQNSNTEYLANQLHRLISKYDVISLDIFDTTIIRLTDTPQDIFTIIDNKLDKIGISGFSDLRKNCAELAAIQYGKKTSLDYIYELMNREWQLSTKKLNQIKQMEIDTEIENSIINETVKDIILIAKKQEKEVIFISDMYLPAKILSSMLKRLGVTSQYKVISSCEAGRTKRDGSLFAYAVNEFSITNKRILHFGDDLRSDVINAWFTNDFSCVYMPRLKGDSLTKMKYYGCSVFWDKEKRWSFQSIAPVVWCFCAWLEEKILKLNINKVFFLTREGAFFYELFNEFTNKNYSTDVLFASRRSIIGATADVNWERIYDYFKNSDLYFLCEVFNLNIEKVEKIADAYNIDMSRRLDCYDAKIVAEMLAVLKKDILTASAIQKEYIKKYLAALGVDKCNALVDIGWKGTSQACLQNLYKKLENKKKFIGLYLGEFFDSKNDCEKYGYLCSSSDDTNKLDVLNAGFIFENILSMSIGSTLKYENKDNDIYPVLENDIRKDNQSIQKAQSGIFEFFNLMLQRKEIVAVDEKMVIDEMFKTFRKPSLTEAETIGDIQYMDANCLKYIAKPRNLLYYFIHPYALADDIHYCGWNTGFCRRLFKINLPYFYLYKRIKARH